MTLPAPKLTASRRPPERPTPATADGGTPETVRYLLLAWVIMLGGELVHQLFSIAMPLIDPSPLIESARETGKTMSRDVPEEQVRLVAYVSIAMLALLSLTVILVLAIALAAVAKKKSWAEGARRLLVVFSAYFALRLVTVFALVPAGEVPTAVIAMDGVIQILAGVAGLCAIIFASQDEVKRWTAHEGKGHNDPHDSTST